MTTRRPVSWFLTDTGRRFSFAAVTATGISLVSAKFVPHTLLLNKYRDFVQFYSNGKPAPLSHELRDRFNKCMDLLNLPDAHKRLITPFRVFGFDLFHAGSCKSRFGAIVGIPVHFTYTGLSDIKKDNVQVNHKPVEWSSGAGADLADALLLSEEVQRFGICREILGTRNAKVFIDATYPFASVLLAYTLSQTLNRRLRLYEAPLAVRAILYTLIGLFASGVYVFLKDYTEVYYETQVDKELCELGPEFIRSGVEFYDKLLKRNRALRKLMGSEGERKYSVKGNENFILRQPRIALVHRKMYFENMLNEERSKASMD